ncbi:Maf-like protein YceF [mine drainage metagenome]|uniref:Maf-like protein YceF n=1 Tax=mine drainage metagenome TaxID=410659 RepID=A0A1J5S9M5_9ZZZZ
MKTVLLASTSRTRISLLMAAGVPVEAHPPGVDEAAVKQALRAEGASPEAAAEALAELKATRLSLRRPEALVVGADQMLDCENRWFDKPDDRAAARRQLLELRGRRHRLISAVVMMQNGVRLWHHTAGATLTMRAFSEAFLDTYLEKAGPAILSSVGAYQLEGLGSQLFSAIDGDHFTILGLPLLPLLEMFRQHGVIPT